MLGQMRFSLEVHLLPGVHEVEMLRMPLRNLRGIFHLALVCFKSAGNIEKRACVRTRWCTTLEASSLTPAHPHPSSA